MTKDKPPNSEHDRTFCPELARNRHCDFFAAADGIADQFSFVQKNATDKSSGAGSIGRA
jgi:hypothetical protein